VGTKKRELDKSTSKKGEKQSVNAEGKRVAARRLSKDKF